MQLRPGYVIRLQGEEYVVRMVNDCRAFCVPVRKKQVTITPLSGKPVSFTKTEAGISITPNPAEVEFIRREKVEL